MRVRLKPTLRRHVLFGVRSLAPRVTDCRDDGATCVDWNRCGLRVDAGSERRRCHRYLIPRRHEPVMASWLTMSRPSRWGDQSPIDTPNTSPVRSVAASRSSISPPRPTTSRPPGRPCRAPQVAFIELDVLVRRHEVPSSLRTRRSTRKSVQAGDLSRADLVGVLEPDLDLSPRPTRTSRGSKLNTPPLSNCRPP